MGSETNLSALFAEYEQNSAITVLEPGQYKFEVTSATPRGTGLVPVFKALEGPETGKRVMAGGIYAGNTEGGANAFFRKLEKFGLGKDFFQGNPSIKDVATALVGRVVTITVGVEEWQGEPRNTMGLDIKLESAPPLPAAGGVPAAALAAAPTPDVPTTPAPASAAPVAPAPAADDPGF